MNARRLNLLPVPSRFLKSTPRPRLMPKLTEVMVIGVAGVAGAIMAVIAVRVTMARAFLFFLRAS